MILIYGKGRAGNGVAGLCSFLGLPHEIRDDADRPADFSAYSEIVPSPGIPQSHAVYATGKVTSELDFGFRYLPRGFKISAVTGTDGKSTTTWMLYEILRKRFGADKVFVSGNFEIPFCETVRGILETGKTEGFVVLEVSSFMAYALKNFRADWSVFTNFAEDHLNWHPDLGEYFRAKWRLFERTSGRCLATPEVLAQARKYGVDASKAPLRVFGGSPELADRVAYPDVFVGGHKAFSMGETRFRGEHNARNALAAALVAAEAGVPPGEIRAHLTDVSGLPHRIEKIAAAGGVDYVDDSKATTPQALEAALGAFEKPVLLIAGGSDKGADFLPLAPVFRARVKEAFLIGATRGRMAAAFAAAGVPHYAFDETDGAKAMAAAVAAARASALPGETVLLSPGCASFGLFRDYADRAEKFRAAVAQTPGFAGFVSGNAH